MCQFVKILKGSEYCVQTKRSEKHTKLVCMIGAWHMLFFLGIRILNVVDNIYVWEIAQLYVHTKKGPHNAACL